MPQSSGTHRVLGSSGDVSLPSIKTYPEGADHMGQSEVRHPPIVITNMNNNPTSSSGPTESEFECPICSDSMVTLEQLNQHLDDVHINDPEEEEAEDDDDSDIALSPSPNSAVMASSPTPHRVGSPSFLNRGITQWIRNGLEASSAKVGQFGQDSGYLSPERHQKVRVPIQSGSLSQISPARRNIKIDVLDNNRGFSMRDSDDTAPSLPTFNNGVSTPLSAGTPSSKRITRNHWQEPSSNGHDVCLYPGCSLPLNVKNGKVNCRKCGRLFCNKHTHYRVRLKNGSQGSGPKYEPLKDGVWSRVCQECHQKKPELTVSTEAVSNDQTDAFMMARAKFSETREIERSKIQKHLIKELNLLAEYYVDVKHEGVALLWNTLKGSNKWTPEYILEQQILIIGRQNWLQNKDVKFCPLCYSKFNLLTRRHHCRTCGRIVCDGTLNDKGLVCLMDVPGGVFLERLPRLNYSPVVKENLRELQNANDIFRFRVCLDCKNLLISGVKKNHDTHDEFNPVLELLDTILACKARIRHLVDRFQVLIKTEGANTTETNKTRVKLMGFVREFEGLATTFRGRFFIKVASNAGPEVVKPCPDFPADVQMAINNIYLGSIMFLQQTITEIKSSSQELRAHDREVIEQQKSVEVVEKEEPKASLLTKREIRTLRDELMVMNEQSFIVENLIQTATKERRFDEILSLNDNKLELETRIRQLKDKLGEHSF